jgi:hypothetical protein
LVKGGSVEGRGNAKVNVENNQVNMKHLTAGESRGEIENNVIG